jgi:hypothetical protein
MWTGSTEVGSFVVVKRAGGVCLSHSHVHFYVSYRPSSMNSMFHVHCTASGYSTSEAKSTGSRERGSIKVDALAICNMSPLHIRKITAGF